VTIKKLLLLLLFLLILNAFSVYAQVCGGTINSNTTLAANLNCAGNGLKISTSNIYLNCSGFNITGNQVLGTYGILLDGVTNVKVVNCNVRNFSFGLLVDQSNFSYVFNNTLDNNRPGAGGGYGIYVNYSNNGTFYRNVINRSDTDGIRIRESAGNNFTKNVLDLNDDRAIYMFRNCRHSYFIRNNISRTRFFSAMGSANFGNDFNLIAFNRISGGTNFQQFDNNNITKNLFFDATGLVILQTGSNNVISKNVLRNTSGLRLGSGTNNNTIINNTAYDGRSTRGQFQVSGGAILVANRFINNKAFNNRASGFWGVNVYKIHYINNTAYDNNASGFDLYINGAYMNISHNTAYNNSGDGFYIDGLIPFTLYDIVHNNTAYNNSGDGFDFFDCANANITDNLAYYNGMHGIYIHKPGGGGGGGPLSNLSVRDSFVYNNSGHGVFVNNSNNEFIINNTIQFNNWSGIALLDSNSINITLNTVLNHTLSINLTNSSSNIIYDNKFYDPPRADGNSAGNSWNIAKTLGTNIIGGPFLGGNYWRFYNGTDIDKDGLGDTLLPWQGFTNQIINGGDFHPLLFGAWSAQMVQQMVNSTFGTNFTFENLTCYGNGATNTSNNVTYHGYFFKDGIPQFNILNRSFYNGSSSSNDEAFGVAVDSNDSMIIVGKLEGNWEIVKYSSDGTFLWNITIPKGSTFTEQARDVAVDSQDNILVTGSHFIGVTKYAWTMKLTPNGMHVWNKTIANSEGYGVTTDSSNNVTITGIQEVGGRDVLLAKYDANGNLQWTSIIDSGTVSDYGEGVAVDSQDNIAVTGLFNNNGFIFKYYPNGTQIWNVTNLYPTTPDWLYGVDTDSQDNIIAAGLAYSPNFNVSVFKYTPGGSQIWNTTTGGSSSDRADGVVVDYEDNIIISGITNSFGVTGNNIYTVKFYSNGTKAWQVLGDFGLNERGYGIDVNSWGEPVIGGRQSPVSGGRRMLLVNYKGFFDYNQTPGILKNVSMVNYTLTRPRELWRCDLQAFDGNTLSTTQKSNDVLIRSPTPSSIQCSRNIPNNFMNCSNLSYFDNITQVRVSCQGASSATFNLTNLYDGTTFFVNSTNSIVGGFFVLDNSDVQILDSGNWSLKADCNYGTVVNNATSYFYIPFGNITNAQMLSSSQSVNNGQSFNIATSIGCAGGECVNISVVLDPINPATNLTNPGGAVHRVYTDSQFIYAASQDSNTYVWNKTSLGLFATLPSSAPLRTVWADSQYIYTGGTNNQIELWNRTDLATPFANVANLTFSLVPYSIRSDSNYIYAGLGARWGGSGRIEVYNKNTFALVANLTNATNIIRSLDVDSNYLYAADHGCNLWIYDITAGFTSISLAVNPGCTQLKDVSVDNNYIYAHGQVRFSDAFTQVWHKSNRTQVFGWNDTTGNYYGASVFSGGSNFAYHSGPRNGWWSDGWIGDINKSSWTIASIYNVTNLVPKTIYCDSSYLYAGMLDPTAAGNDGVYLFNNPCIIAPPPVPIIINSVSINPANFPVTTNNVQCVANVTTPGTVANVTFNITFPNGSSILLGSTNAGDIYTSSNFTVNSTSDHNCTVTANNTNGTSASSTLSFFGGHKGIIPMNAGSPFYTTSQNPRNGSHQACLNSLIPGQNCTSTWNVVANGNPGDTWAFFSIYSGSNINTSRINITILGGPGPTPTPSGGGGGGSATRAWQQEEILEEICIESWFCEPWSECKFGEQTRVCVDLNACGTEKNKPPESMPCKEDVVEEPAVVAEELDVEEITREEPKPTVVEGPEEKGLAELLFSRNVLRALLAVVVIGALVYVFALSKFLARKKMPKKPRMKAEDFKPAPKKPAKKAKPKPVKEAPKKPVTVPETTKDILKELDKL